MRARTAKAVHTHRFSGNKKSNRDVKTRTAKAVHAYRFSGNIPEIVFHLFSF